MSHSIRFVSDEDMPEGQNFILVGLPHGALILYRESALCPQVLEDSWAAFRALGSRSRPQPPRCMPNPMLLSA